MFDANPQLLPLLSDPNGISRISLARATGLSASKVGKLARQLLDLGILTEEGRIETARGRQPILLKPSQTLGFLIGVDIGMVNCRVLVADMQGTIVGTRSMPTNASDDVDRVLERIFSATDSLLVDAGIPRDRLLAVGVSHSGGTDPETGECLYWHAAMHWKGVSLSREFAKRYGAPSRVDDSVRCMTLAEATYGLARNVKDFVLLNVGHGIGSGLFLTGNLFRGSSGIAGELGHVIILPNGPRCTCGNYGCLETLASGRSIVSAMRTALHENVTTHLQEVFGKSGDEADITVWRIAEAARAGDRVAQRILDHAGEYLGIAVANLVNFINPSLIVLAGGVMASAGDILMEIIERHASRRAFEAGFRSVAIRRSELGDLSAARGAALMMSETALKEVMKRIEPDGTERVGA